MEKKYSLWNPPPLNEREIEFIPMPSVDKKMIEALEQIRDDLTQSLGVSEELLQ